MESATQGDQIPLELHQALGGGACWWEVPTHLSLSGTPTSDVPALQHRLRIPILDQDTHCPLCGKVLDCLYDHAAVCPCARDPCLLRSRPACKPSLPRKRKPACSNPAQTLTDLGLRRRGTPWKPPTEVRVSSSVHRDSARATLLRVRFRASIDAPTTLGLDAQWTAWDDPNPDTWSAEFDSQPNRSDDDGSHTTTTMAT